jgi:4a-hydroxytetrahydrobiopterin dehydratase
MERRKLDADEIVAGLGKLNGWTADGDVLKKRYAFENFAAALTFVNRVGEIAERHDHHPDIVFGWGYAEISLTTHDRGGITPFDFAVASEIDS